LDRKDFEQAVLSLQGSLYRLACVYLKEKQDRLDAISEAVLKAWIKLDSLRKPESFRPFLMKILVRECLNIRRHRRREIPMEVPEDDSISLPETSLAIRLALEDLPEYLRVAVALHYMEGLGTREIARLLSVTNGAVCSRLARARDRLRIALKEDAT
jgi:RNA polymerase sigma-70 factor (ECF subfamily)